MDIKIWGNSLWELIHTISFKYTVNKKNNYNLFFNLLKNIIPCEKCRNHYIYYFNKYKIQNFLNNHNDLIKWVNNLHNDVNKRLYKKTYSLKESKKKYYDPNKVLIINDKKIFNFIQYFAINNNSRTFKIFFKLILDLYPNDIIKNELINYNKKNNINNVNFNELKKWYNNLKIDKIITKIPKNLINTGSWIKSAKNYYIKNENLYGYLRKKNKKYVFSSIKFSNKKYSNIDGRFVEN